MASSKHTPIFRVRPCFRSLTSPSSPFRDSAFLNDVCIPREPRGIRHTPSSLLLPLLSFLILEEALRRFNTGRKEASPAPDQCVKNLAVLVEIHGISSLTQALISRLSGIRHIPSLINFPFCGRGKLHVRWKHFAPDESVHTFLLSNIGEIKLFFTTLALINHAWEFGTPLFERVPDVRYDLELELEFQQFAEEAHLTTRQERKLANIIAGYLSGYHNFIVTGTTNRELITRSREESSRNFRQAALKQWSVAAACHILCQHPKELCKEEIDREMIGRLIGYRFLALYHSSFCYLQARQPKCTEKAYLVALEALEDEHSKFIGWEPSHEILDGLYDVILEAVRCNAWCLTNLDVKCRGEDEVALN